MSPAEELRAARPEPYYADDSATLYLGDCREVLAGVADVSVDAVVCDPPYELEFMGRDWDASGVAFDPVTWRECLRVLKPGGHLVAFGGTRTYHRMTVAIEDAGFEIRDSMHWIYGSGFPKSLDVGKAIDKVGGVSPQEQALVLRQARERSGLSREQVAEAVGCTLSSVRDWEEGRRRSVGAELEHLVPSPEYRSKLANLLGYTQDERVVVGVGGGSRGLYETGHRGIQYGVPVTPDAQRWEGFGTALKPGHEPIVLARKPLAGTVAANVLTYGTGALNIAACRVEPTGESRPRVGEESQERRYTDQGGTNFAPLSGVRGGDPAGRWPTNVVFTHSAGCVEDGPCTGDCPVGDLDRQSGHSVSVANKGARRSAPISVDFRMKGDPGDGYADSGGASRFFPAFRYEAKAPSSERPKLADGTAHSTVKPLTLMRWLVRLVTPPDGTVLDPFAGSGTTGEACVIEGFRCVMAEREQPHAELIKARLSKPLQPSLFGEVVA